MNDIVSTNGDYIEAGKLFVMSNGDCARVVKIVEEESQPKIIVSWVPEGDEDWYYAETDQHEPDGPMIAEDFTELAEDDPYDKYDARGIDTHSDLAIAEMDLS